MACRDPSAFHAEIATCTTPFEGVATCSRYVAATKTYGAECLALPTFGFKGAPPYGPFACQRATGEMAALCKEAGFSGSGPGSSSGSGSGSDSGTSTQNTFARIVDDNLGTGAVGTTAKYVGYGVGGVGSAAAVAAGASVIALAGRHVIPKFTDPVTEVYGDHNGERVIIATYRQGPIDQWRARGKSTYRREATQKEQRDYNIRNAQNVWPV